MEAYLSGWADFITVRLVAGDVYDKPCAFLQLAGLAAFWDALGVAKDAEEKLQPEWVKGNLIPVAPAFPILSWLIQMQIDNSVVKIADVAELLREIAIARRNCRDLIDVTAFDELEKAGNFALAQGRDISLSPFG